MNIISPKWHFSVAAVLILLVTLALAREPLARFFFRRGAQAKAEWRLEDAARHFRRALFLKSDFFEARFEKGVCHQLRGDFLASQRVLKELSRETIQDTALRARLLNAIGVNHFNANEPDAAMEAHKQSLELARELGDRRLEGRGLIDLSRVFYHSKGQPDAGLNLLHRALQIAHETGDELIEADALRNTGVVYWWLKGELNRPLVEYYEPALKIYRRQNDQRSAAITLTNIGHIHRGKGDYLQFLKYENEAVEIKTRIGDLAGLSDSYSALGYLYEGIENYRRASEYLAKSLALSRRIGYRLTQNDVETLLARVHMGLGEFDQAIHLLKELPDRASHTPLLAKYYTAELARCYLLRGEPELALRYAEELNFGPSDSRSRIGALIILGQVYTELGDWQKASLSLARAEELFRTLEGTYWDGEVLYHGAQAELAERQGQRSLALNYLLNAAEIESRILSSDGNRFLRGQDRRIYDRLFALLLDQAKNDSATSAVAGGPRPEDVTAFHLVEQLRYRAFRNFVAHLREQKPESLSTRPREAEAISRIERVSARLRERESLALREQLRQAYSDYEDLVLRSEMAQPQYRLVREARPAELASVQKALNAETALVEYLFAGDKVFALVITRSALKSVTVPVNRPNLSAKVKLLRSMIFKGASSSDSSDLGWQSVSEDLRRVLIEPIEQTGALGGVRRLGLVPSGLLHDLPFAALVRAEDGRVKFLIEDYAIFHAPSATYLTSERSNRSRDGTSLWTGEMISFGRNESDEAELSPLKFAAEEALAVARIFGGEARVGAQASETGLKQESQRFNFIHLATHAVAEPEMPLLARLKLQSTREDDGDLSVREILDLGLKAELVTLGACRTGQSFSASGSELGELDRIGLIEAFLHAGAESVLASLLPINDRSTTEFMKGFYQNLRSQDKADALASTQRAMLRGELTNAENDQPRRLTHPRYWAPFILVGDYR